MEVKNAKVEGIPGVYNGQGIQSPAQVRQKDVLHRQSILPLKGTLKAAQIFDEAQTQLYYRGKSAHDCDRLPKHTADIGF